MTPILFALPGNESLGTALSHSLDVTLGNITVRRFPDGESYVRFDSEVAQRAVVLLCTLDRPDDKVLPILFAAGAAKELGAASVGLVAPYLAYLRQDRRFQPGESTSSRHFASLISGAFDWVVTVDPHLHRYATLGAVYSIPTSVLHAAPRIAAWIRAEVSSPLLIGPDSESGQWVSEVATVAEAPYVVLEKRRRGDRDVEVSVPEVERWRKHTPVLVDDIISTARTMIETVRHLHAAGLAAPVCIGVHAVFAGDGYLALRAIGVERIVTCNTIAHPTNEIDLGEMLVRGTREMLAQEP